MKMKKQQYWSVAEFTPSARDAYHTDEWDTQSSAEIEAAQAALAAMPMAMVQITAYLDGKQEKTGHIRVLFGPMAEIEEIAEAWVAKLADQFGEDEFDYVLTEIP